MSGETSERWCIINAEMNNKRIGVLASALVGCIFTLSAQDLTMENNEEIPQSAGFASGRPGSDDI